VRPARIQDVAQRAGVSWKTVSNVLHGRSNVRPETRARVEAAIAELNYRPNLASRQLRMGRTHLLALAVPAISDPYFGELAHAIIEGAASLGYTVLIDETHGSTEQEGVVAEGFQVRLIEGIIFSPLSMTGPQLASRRDRTPVVLLGEHVTSNDSGLDHVAIDNVASAEEATRHLIQTGRKRIAFLGHQAWRPHGTGQLRLDGYQQALRSAGLPVDRGLVLRADAFSREEGEDRLIELLPRIREVDAVVCANDLLAIGAMRALRRAKVSVPDEVAVLGWDGTPEGAYTQPTLTTVAPDKQALARTAIDTLLRRIEGDVSPPVTHVVPHRLVVRESTGRPRSTS
jgi:LacI family transcriptional regulator, repressor for deo operon, udp, cdd, tsx, nupC, and nupG